MPGPPFFTANGCPPLKLPHKDTADPKLIRANWDELEYWAMQIVCGGEACSNIRVIQTVAQSIPTATITDLIVDTSQGSCGHFTLDPATGIITANDAGDYLIFGSVMWVETAITGGVGLRSIALYRTCGTGTSSRIAVQTSPATPFAGWPMQAAVSVSAMMPLATGDKIRAQVCQSSGVAMNTHPDDAGPNTLTYLALVKKCACCTPPLWFGGG